MRATLVRAAATAAALALGATMIGSGGTPAAAQATVAWEAFQLEPLNEAELTTVFDINEAGFSAGQSDVAPVLWTPDGEVVALPLPEGYVGGAAFALNDQQQAVGLVFDQALNGRGVVWTATTTTLLDVGDVAIAITPSGVMIGIDVTGLVGETECCASGWVQKVGGPQIKLPGPSTVDLRPAAGTDSGIVVGTAFQPDTLLAGVGWFEEFVFPIGGNTVETYLEPFDVIPAPAVLAGRFDGEGGIETVALNRFGQITPLAHPSNIDIAIDMNSYGVAVGAGATSVEVGPEVGRIYAFGGQVSLVSLLDEAPAFDLNDPIGLNDDLEIIGNSQDGSSWMLRRAVPAAAKVARSYVAPKAKAGAEPLPAHRGEPDLPGRDEGRIGWG